jgi:hypothetical protein
MNRPTRIVRNSVKKILFLTVIAMVMFIINDAMQNRAHTSSAGAPAGRTGSPGDGANCTGCHAGSPVTQAGLITSNIPAGGYTPGQTYQITGTVTSPGRTKFGFQISPQSPSGTLLGTLVNATPSLTQIIGNNKYITHTAAGNQGSNGSHTWTFNWTAPAAGTGNVTFYGAFNATNNNSSSSGDIIFLSTLAVQECIIATPSINNGSQSVYNLCQGETLTLNASTAAAYLWSTGATTPSIQVSSAGTYSVSAINGNGCSATSASVTVNVLPPAPPPSISTGGNTQLCQGQTLTLSTGVSNCYLWQPGGQTTSSIQVSQSGTYSVTTCDNNGCTSTSAPLQVTVVPNPPAPQISASGSSVFCDGDSVILTSSAATAYTWSNGSSNASVTITQGGSYTVNIQDNNGCSASSAPFVVTVNPNPSPVISTGGANGLCPNDSLTLDAGSGFSTYLWNTGETTQTIIINNPGQFQVSVSDAAGCTGSSGTPLQINLLQVDTSVSLNTATLSANASAATYQWIDCINQSLISGATQQTYSPAQNGSYAVIVTTADGCTDTSSCYQVIVTGNKEHRIQASMLELYPLPAHDILHLNFSGFPTAENAEVQVRDALGRIVLQNTLQVVNQSASLSCESLNDGMYFLSINYSGQHLVKRWMVQH